MTTSTPPYASSAPSNSAPHVVLAGNVGAQRDGDAAGGRDAVDDLLGGTAVAGVMHDDAQAIRGQAVGDSAADAA